MKTRKRYLYGKEPIEINAGRRTVRLTVHNTGDRAIQVGSHYHFFEVNSALSFDRQQALGMHLNIAAGTSVRIEPGGTREVELCSYAGTGRLVGFSGLLNGSLASHPVKVEAVRRAIELGFQGARDDDGPTATKKGPKNNGSAKGSKDSKDSKGKKKGSR
ncbi:MULTISPECIES: urease subunit beta [unclassified Streptomyces]|uniref:urease subunit beta n=1 Tax=unclassified Streptomyces TaxID=2593676 RepID=UPI0035DD849D